MDCKDEKGQINTVDKENTQISADNTTKGTKSFSEGMNSAQNDEQQHSNAVEKANALISADNTTKATETSPEVETVDQNSGQEFSIDTFKEAGTKARLEANNKRKAAEKALAETNKKQQESMKCAMKQNKCSTDLPTNTASKEVESTSSSNLKDESSTFLSESEITNSLNALLMGKSLLSPLAGLEKLKSSHQLQMDKLIADIEAVMVKKPVVTKVEKDND